MNIFEAIKVVEKRMLKLESDNVTRRIIGYIYMESIPDEEVILLAKGPDTLIHNFVSKAKAHIHSASEPVSIPNFSLSESSKQLPESLNLFDPVYTGAAAAFSAPDAYQRVHLYWNPVFSQVPDSASMVNESGWRRRRLTGLDNQHGGTFSFPNDYYTSEAAFNNSGITSGRNSRSLTSIPVKTCHYFNKGYCKHGLNCRYLHGESFPGSYASVFCPNSYDFWGEDQVFSPRTLDRLEVDITELLKSQQGIPVSIASLPMMYYEKYGRILKAEGYLTESQRHGKAGFSLTKLLARLKGIRLIDRPHGQHAVILAEDASKYMLEIHGERNDPDPCVCSSHQIYLTFPSESTFTEEEVRDHFSTFGPVVSVRIPTQQKRMFGFVSFVSADSVRLILSERNPHYVCGSRVLVKPYRERAKPNEKNYYDKYDYSMYYRSNPVDIDSELQARWESSRSFRRLLTEEHALADERMKLLQLHLARKLESRPSCFDFPMDEIEVPQDRLKIPSAEFFNHLLEGVWSSGSNTSDEDPKCPANNCVDQESGVEELSPLDSESPSAPSAVPDSTSIPEVI